MFFEIKNWINGIGICERLWTSILAIALVNSIDFFSVSLREFIQNSILWLNKLYLFAENLMYKCIMFDIKWFFHVFAKRKKIQNTPHEKKAKEIWEILSNSNVFDVSNGTGIDGSYIPNSVELIQLYVQA